MLVRTVKFVRPNSNAPQSPIPPDAVKDLYMSYSLSGKLLSRESRILDAVTNIETTIWDSKEDYDAFIKEAAYQEWRNNVTTPFRFSNPDIIITETFEEI